MKIAVSRFRVAASTRQLLATAALLLGIAWQPGGFTADDKLVMNMRDADIRSLIQWVADITGKNLVVHKDVQGKVTVLSAEPLTPAEAYQVFLATLEVHGFAAIDADGAVKIVPQSMASASSPPLPPSGGLLARAMLWGTIFTAPSASIAAKPWTSSVARKTW